MTLRPALVPALVPVLGAALATLAACGGGGGGDVAAPGTAPTAPIRAQLEPAALARVAWGPAKPALAPDGTWKTYDTGTTWNWQLQGDVRTDHVADVYVLDLFAQLDGRVQDELHALGRDAFCYFSVGTFEPWRPDAAFFDALPLGEPHALYPDERWLDVTSPDVVRIMVNRLDMATAIGCDGVELDNVDGHGARTGFAVTEDRQVEFARTLANAAHRRGLAVALKNGPAILDRLVDWFDLSIVEECFEYRECDAYAPMVAAGKPVFNAEYKLFDADMNEIKDLQSLEGRAELCRKAAERDVRATLLPLALDGSFRFACDA